MLLHEQITYNARVTPDEFWEAVGELLAKARRKRNWKPIDVERHGGPNYKAVQDIDRGVVKKVEMLARYADALGLSLLDILRSALDRSAKSITPEAAQILRKFEQTTVEGRQALLSLAQALPDQVPEPERPSSPQSRGGLPGKAPRKP